MRFVDESGRALLRLPAQFAGGDLEVLRSDLSRILYERSSESTEYLFGDSIASLTQSPSVVDVTFASGRTRAFDLVIGADGIHSRVRHLAFGPGAEFVRFLGYYVAGWELPNELGFEQESVGYNVPGKLANAGAISKDRSTAGAFFVFACRPLDFDREDKDRQRALIARSYAGVGWHTPHLVDSLRQADDLYFDSISRVDVKRWSVGRSALIGDAACGATLGGMGTGTAIVAALVLAGELTQSDGDHATAFAAYQEAMGAYARRCQRGGDRAGAFLAPKTALGIRARNRLLANRHLMNALLRSGEDRAGGLALEKYPG